ncbi:hypothetical protein, partial [Streptomyces sp. SAS_270]|uniref:hypothetical protein n=1 Tax=Streptomyces sp. SAS_270 TaxID=3412748 RepID=UPI00403C9868
NSGEYLLGGATSSSFPVQDNPIGSLSGNFVAPHGLLHMPVLIFHWGEWIPFAGASIYLLWELGRTNSALGELTDLWNEQRQESARNHSLQ